VIVLINIPFVRSMLAGATIISLNLMKWVLLF
jgi:hypothetical protein